MDEVFDVQAALKDHPESEVAAHLASIHGIDRDAYLKDNKTDSQFLAEFGGKTLPSASTNGGPSSINLSPESLSNRNDPLNSAGTGAILGGAISASKMAADRVFPRQPATVAPQLIPDYEPGPSGGQRYKAKTGYGAGEGETSKEVSDEWKRIQAEKTKGAGRGKIASRITGGSPDEILARAKQEEAELADQARIRAQIRLKEEADHKIAQASALEKKMAYEAEKKFHIPNTVGKMLPIAGATAGYNIADVMGQDNPIQKTIAGVGAVGSAAPFISKLPPKYRAIGMGASLLAPVINRGIDAIQEHAAGGAIQHFAGLKSGAVKLAAKMSPGIEESLGKILPKSKPLTLAEKFGYDPVKLRNEYPQTSFPVSAWDKNKEAYYAAKNPSSEELALKAARDFAQEEIKSGSSAYKPYFDISKRGYVDPSNYPLPGPQTTSVIPKQQKTIDAYTAKFQNPEAIQKWSDAYELAKNSPNAHHFYAMDQLEKEYVKAYGPELGRHKFKTEFADQMANTTSGVTPTNNLLTAAYVNHMNASGLPLPGHALGEYSGYSFDAPHPVQGGRIGANLAQSNKYAEAGNQLNPLENPKRYDFSGNFMGHPGLTMDEQMMTPFGMAAPPKGSYGLAELEGAKQAALKGVTVPSDWQSVTWAGLKALKDSKGKELSPDELSKIGQPMIEDVNQAIHRTSRVLNISPKEALDQLLKNKPMYGVGAIGAGASQNEDPQTKKAGGKIDFLAFKIKQNIKKKK